MELTAEAATPQALFESLAHQLFERLTDQQEVGQALREKIMVDAADLEGLLRDGLQALLALTVNQKMIFGQVSVIELKSLSNGLFSLQLDALGELIDTQRHTFRLPVADLTLPTVHISKIPGALKAVAQLIQRTPKQ